MWESPIYKFKIKVNDEDKEIYIDVTGSAPNFSVPGKQLEGTFAVLLAGLDPKKTKILDFGGAKLRNTLYLLEQGFTVYACEYDDLFKRSRQAFDYLKSAEKYPNFKKLVFPKDFINFEEKFDVILLINVLDVMPVPIERLCVLALCREQMKEGGRLLWYTQHGAYSEENAVALLNDGLVTGKGRQYHMFYRDFSRKEIYDMLESTGFSYNKNFKFPMAGSNQAFVFNADGPIIIDSTMGLIQKLKTKVNIKTKTIERNSGLDEKIYEVQVPKKITVLEDINILEQYRKELKEVKPGKKEAQRYHNLIFIILKEIFRGKLNNPKKEECVANRTQRCDITFQNQRINGFFKQLAEGYNITCPNIFIECKNYSEDLENTEIFQIRSRLNKRRGQFGIICCRKIENRTKLKERLDDAIKKEEYIIIFEDTDIINLIDFKLKKEEDKIDDYVEDKFKILV